MLRDESNDATNGWKTDYLVQQFIRQEKVNVPLVEMHRYSGPDNQFHFTVMSRAKGSTIQTIWHTLTLQQKTEVLLDLKRCIREWRKITSPYMQKVDGSELRDGIIGTCTGLGCIRTGLNEEEWLENLTLAMRKGFLIDLWRQNNGSTNPLTLHSWIRKTDKKVAELKAKFPRGGPYILTHGDLHGENIFISDENKEKSFKVTAIIDWEKAGFFPWWAERFSGQLSEVFQILGQESKILYPEHEVKEWDEIKDNVLSLYEAWYRGGNHTVSKHTPDKDWAKFCACRPYAQNFREIDFGWKDEHLDIFDVDSTDSEDEEEDDDKKFPKLMRDFLRWFNEINKYKAKDTLVT
jgi:hypothetical protein